MNRPVGIGQGRRRTGPSQAQLVAAWLGTYELLLHETVRYVVIGDRKEVIQSPGPDALAAAATQVVLHMDFDEPWIGHHLKEGPDA